MQVGPKRDLFVINGEKLLVDYEKKEMTGAKHLIDEIKKKNDELRGSKVTCRYNCYIDNPPGDLWNPYALCPLICYIFGNENVTTEVLEWYPEPDDIVY